MTATALKISSEVAQALADGRAVVALESTVIAHGLPAPHNLEVALAMQANIRKAGAVPATIAVMGGRLVVGISDAQIEMLASAAPGEVRKCSRRDLSIALASGKNAATTVCATMIGAELAGIELFATGGIGGVHRGAPHDVSADLSELGRTPVTVVCSGPKSILDLALTREVLETNGVPVIGYGCDTMPAFYSLSSAMGVDTRVDDPGQAAAIIRARAALDLASGLVITVPVPGEAALEPAQIDAAISTATQTAHSQGIAGAQVTPFVLSMIAQLTDGKSLAANKALLLNNASVAARIAVAVCKSVAAG
ncbi:MAG: pseudouridine-5'-phosphate glycosidase [Alphaproteobacteria bacterium]